MTTQADDEMQNEPLLNPDLLVKICATSPMHFIQILY